MQAIFKRIISNLIKASFRGLHKAPQNTIEEKTNLYYLMTGLSKWTLGSRFSPVSLRNVHMRVTFSHNMKSKIDLRIY